MGTHLRVLSDSFPMIPTLQGLDGFQKLWTKVASALEGLNRYNKIDISRYDSR